MPFARPTLTDLRTQTAADINAALPGVDAMMRYSNLGILGEVLAGLSAGHYGYGDWIALQAVPFTATGEFLEGWAALKGVIRKAAERASGPLTFTAADGAVLPAGTVVTRSDGFSYTIDSTVVAANGQVVAAMTALDAGAAGNCGSGVALTLGAGISGVLASGSTLNVVLGGSDVETDADLRTRMLAAYAAPPQGGSITDYPGWALAVPGVTRAWLRPAARGPGTLDVLFMMDELRAAQGGFPAGGDGVSTYETRAGAATGDQLIVANAIFPKQSVCALVYVASPAPNAINIAISGLATASGALKSSVADRIRAALLVGAIPGGVTHLDDIQAAIKAVPGTAGFLITHMGCTAGTIVGDGDNDVGNIQSAAGALPFLNSVSWV